MFTWLGFEWRVALRFLREGRMQTVLIIVGVAAGVAVIAYISALINGLQNSTLTKTLGAQAHISVRAPDDVVTPAAALQPGTSVLGQTQPRAQRPRAVANWQALLALLEKMPNVAGVSPMVSGAGLALRGEAVQSIALMGVELERYDRMVGLRAKVVSGTARLEPGEASIGRQLAQDLEYIAIGQKEGAKLHGGEALATNADGAPGFYLRPALFTETTPQMRINREEIFGPVVSIQRVKSYDEALALANDTPFGLASGIATTSLKHATHFKRHAQAGMVMVNLPTAGVDYHVPFGGRKGSSYGSREQGRYAAEFYTTVKTAYIQA